MWSGYQYAYSVTSMDERRPKPLYNIKTHLTPRGCFISHFKLLCCCFIEAPFLKNKTIPLLLLSSWGPSLSREERWNSLKMSEGSPTPTPTPTRSAEFWPLYVPALSQLRHRACSPDCMVTHWVSVAWMRCACISQFPFSRPFWEFFYHQDCNIYEASDKVRWAQISWELRSILEGEIM